MYHMESIDVRAGDRSFLYFDTACACANNMLNVANFYIRNLMTGLKKPVPERTANERDVIETVNGSVPEVNRILDEKYASKVKKVLESGLEDDELDEKLSSIKHAQFHELTPEKWFPGYGLLDAVFKYTDNVDYRAFHSHVMQHAIKERCWSWEGYFESLGSYNAGVEGFTGRPRIPGYKKSGGRSTAVFSNIACAIKGGELVFPYCGKGKERARASLPVKGLPRASKDKLIEVRVVPYCGSYQVQVVTDDGIKEKDILPPADGIIGEDGTPAGVMALAPGLTNFASITDNKGGIPVVVKGGAVKARNQWYNKRMAFLKSEQMKGHDPKTYHPPVTKQMRSLSRKRGAFLRDTFYKYAHYICRLAVERGISFIITGHNRGQKQDIRLGRKTNQAFVQVPFDRFRRILAAVARQYGIRVILQEESYTSKACFGNRDRMPVYGATDAEKAVFTGRRVKRGLYRQDDGKILNADINGSANIGRKYDARIFPEGMDYGYLYGAVRAMRYDDILAESRRYHRAAGRCEIAAPA